jgi:molybdate transport system substrate-binding protein
MKPSFYLILTLVLVATGCSGADSGPETHTLNVFAASSLTEAFTEIDKNFEASNPNVTVTLNFAG